MELLSSIAPQWVPVQLSEHGHYRGLTELFDSGEVHAFVSGDSFSRKDADGIGTFYGTVAGRPVGVIACDFRVDGGTFGKENSARVQKFIRAMKHEKAPILFQLHTMGVRFFEGRTVFQKSFGLIPALAEFAESSLLITSIQGNCLGLGALLYGLGHYQFALAGKSFNLTGPEVFKMFFGASSDYGSATAVERVAEHTPMIHEIVSSTSAVYGKVRALLGLTRSATESNLTDFGELAPLLRTVGDAAVEVLARSVPGVRAFVVRNGRQRVGVLVNPPGRPNLMTVAALQKYRAALALFGKLKAPVVSFVDTAGADPRVEQADRNIVGELIELSRAIVGYRHGLMGVGVGRAYGGGSILSFPKVFGSDKVVLLEGGKTGVMDAKIVSALVQGSSRLTEQWNEVLATQTADHMDMIAAGIIDEVIPVTRLEESISEFLLSRRTANVTAIRSVFPLPRRTFERQAVEDPENSLSIGG